MAGKSDVSAANKSASEASKEPGVLPDLFATLPEFFRDGQSFLDVDCLAGPAKSNKDEVHDEP